MPKFLLTSQYSPEGTKGVLKEGGSSRRAASEKLIKSAGGKLDAFYFMYGKSDVVLIVDLPDNATAAALSFLVGATGMAHCVTTPLITCEEIDMAAKKTQGLDYRKPGQ
jgi:uncharacterized protein with GYD domain